jgi:hypothetical protein
MLPAPNAIREFAQRRQIVCGKQGKTIVKRKSFTAFNLIGNNSQFSVV